MFNVSKFIPNKEHSQTALIFWFHLKKLLSSHTDFFEKVNEGGHVPSQDTCERWFRRLKSGDFDTRQEGRQRTWKTVKKFEDMEFRALLDKNDSPSNWAIVNKFLTTNRQREVGKIEKRGRWVPHELKDRQMENRKNTWHFTGLVQKEVFFASYTGIVQGMKSGFI